MKLNPQAAIPLYDWPAIADSYDPGQDIALTLTFSVIDTLRDRRSADLQPLPWDDPAVIARFPTHLSDVLTRMPQARLPAIATPAAKSTACVPAFRLRPS